MTYEPAEPVVNQEAAAEAVVEDVSVKEETLDEWLDKEGLVLIPEAFFEELLEVMEEHVMRAVGIDRERMSDLTGALELTVGEDSMSAMSMEEYINWIRTLNDM
jgi:hypothetical protein